MSSAEMVSGGMIDPSNLHLKKEMTQIRKAARVLRDPGTSASSWRSPVNSTRSITKHHYAHRQNNDGNVSAFADNNNNSSSYTTANAGGSVKEIKEKRVFLYNWRSQKPESERSKQQICGGGEDDVENSRDEEGSISTRDESVDVDSLSDARNNGGNDGSKSDAYLSENYPSAIFKCKDTDFTPPTMRTIKKKKTKRISYYYGSNSRHHQKFQKQITSKNVVEGLPPFGVGRDDLVNLVDQSDDTEDYCNSEDLRRVSALSPLLARLKSKGWAQSLRSQRKEDDNSISYSTPALSTSSFHRKYGIRNPSTVESWDATTGSFNDADDEVDDLLDLPGRQGCGIPCYWSKRSTPKSRVGSWSCYSPSLSDTLRRKGSSIFCGSQSTHQRRHHHRSSLVSSKRRLTSRATGQSLVPLLTNSGNSDDDDELSTNFGELDLEALSRLDGIRWSTSCRSQEEGLETVAHNGGESSPENVRSLSHKYRPMFFDELIGQSIVVQSLTGAVSRGRIAPVYLFQGPRGTGKTSTARIFAAALNCLATEETKPCGVCRECVDFISGKSRYLREVDGSNKNGIGKIKNLLKGLAVVPQSSLSSEFKVVVVEECHLLPSKTWLAFIRLLEKPLPNVVFVLITADIDNVPRAVLSRCQRHLFNKINNGDIVGRLRKIANDENLDVESDALDLIASNADGSLRDAETMMDQLSLFGKRINISLVNELIGVVSDEKLLDLLELAMSSNATETVIRARELMDSGVDPIVLMSQMATLIVDIIAGTYPNADEKHESFFGGRNLSERELDRLKHALTLLSEAEKHLRNVSSERSTWFTATLLQLGSMPSPDRTHSGSSRCQSSKATDEDRVVMLRETAAQKKLRSDSPLAHEKSASSPISFPRSKDNNVSVTDPTSFNSNPERIQSMVSQDESKAAKSGALRCMNSKMLSNIWIQCIEKCHSKTLRQLLHSHGRLVSIAEVKGGFVAHIAFGDSNVKTRAEGFLSSITNSFEIVLRHNVEVKIMLLPPGHSDLGSQLKVSSQGRSFDDMLTEGGENAANQKESKPVVPPLKRIESIIHEQRLETAWLQAMEKGTPGSISRLKAEKNQVGPADESELVVGPADVPSQNWEDELNREIKALKSNNGMAGNQKVLIAAKRAAADHYPISPSLLHNSSFASNLNKDNMGYESGTGAAGCSGMFCWNNTRPHRRGKAKQGTSLRGRKGARFSWFGECAKSRTADNRYNR